MRLPPRLCLSAWITGIPPQAAASSITYTPFCLAAEKISLPCLAITALFAVTMCLPWSIAFKIKLLAGSIPPITSTTISISGSLTIDSKSSVTILGSISTSRCLASDRTPTREISILGSRGWRPAGSWRILATPVPTVPNPRSPTLYVTVLICFDFCRFLLAFIVVFLGRDEF